MFIFFFSSRRRHTRYIGDWSSDVCSSDLTLREHVPSADARVAAIYRAGKSIKPEGETVVEDGDEVFFLAASDDIRIVMKELRREEAPARRVVIAGGGNIGFRLACDLEDKNQVKLIERD